MVVSKNTDKLRVMKIIFSDEYINEVGSNKTTNLYIISNKM